MPRIFLTAALILIAASLLLFSFNRSQQHDYPPFHYLPVIAASSGPQHVMEETTIEPVEELTVDGGPVSGQVNPNENAPATTIAPMEKPIHRDAIDPQQIVKAADDLMRGDSTDGTYHMTIHTPGWKRQLKLKVTSQGRDKMFIRILSPAKEAGIGSLRIDHEMWNYLPEIEKTLKIPPSMMLQPWMGSDFANDDLVKESSVVNDYNHFLLSIDNLGSHVAYKIELTPKPGVAVVWGKRIQWIRMSDGVPLKEEYYDEQGALIKTLEYSDIGPVSDRVIPRTWTMVSKVKQDHYTVIELIDVTYNLPVKNHVFTLQNLKKIQ